ncbi:hypothetical protein ED733_004305 [Metarhizium rileyi]|uniref:TM7S3/TM198-like domain-containing protein n=1 Tax=Metarhizium rileyi (strain RCEF 4871) TaxID=1649241 RepID=A0A5C6G825_METRR|nr:hypothetical protein ED733_004305 [Metarhizium rileyi]
MRDDTPTLKTTPIPSSFTSKETNLNGKDDNGRNPKETGNTPPMSAASITVTDAPSSTHRPTSSPTPTMATDPSVDNSTFFKATIPHGQLPLPPQLTPGWGVAGTIMLLTGITYTLVGIKNRWIHTFFSTAYMAALGVSVLIVYVMSVPISNALQGGYVVAVVLSACAVGAAATFFKELTEALGCALGGFCISMWLLCLVPGGLVHAVAAKAIFIACFTIVGFVLYFSRWTRDWALIIMISFGGATIAVLGIDCFSRAGLKEFWAYVWDINDNLFPLGADTYPVTKGIRVETAAVIIIFLVGIISQIKLWRIVREKREQRAAERAEDQRNLEHEEENVGRQIEEANARERRQWEQVYGDGTSHSTIESPATDFGDVGSEKRLQASYLESERRSSGEVIEMADMSESDFSRNGRDALMVTEDTGEGKVTVRVAADDVPESTTDVEEEPHGEQGAFGTEANVHSEDQKRHSKRTTASRHLSQAQTINQAPEVVPLPFTVPEGSDSRSEGSRSSIATFADDVESTVTGPRKPKTLAKRLSRGSASLLRSFSHRSGRTGGAGGDVASDAGESTEELVLGRNRRPEDDERSLAATVDDESVSGRTNLSVIGEDGMHGTHENDGANRRSIEINAQLGKNGDDPRENLKMTAVRTKPPPISTVAISSPVIGTEETNEDTTASRGASPTSDDKAVESSREAPADISLLEASESAKSPATVSSASVSLTKDRLPRSLSKAAMSFRTNEWAKHLSNAECPVPDALQVAAVRASNKVKDAEEKSVPVDVEELQKTAHDGAPAPAVRRSFSQASEIGNNTHTIRRSQRQDLPATRLVIPTYPKGIELSNEQRSPLSPAASPAALLRKTSVLKHSPSNFKPIAEEDSIERAADSSIVVDEGSEPQLPASNNSSAVALDSTPASAINRYATPGVVSYSSPQTLIGQREKFLRNKSQGSLLPSTPEPTFANQGLGSDTGSLYNYPIYAAALNTADSDDVPLSQRKEMMRQNSLMSLSHSPSQSAVTSPQHMSFGSSESIPFNSHQPQRTSMIPTQAARDAQLASFRQSVQHELRSGTPILMSSGREAPFRSSSLLSGDREAEVQRNIEMQRNVLLGQKEAEAQRREMQLREKDYIDRAFDERMRNGDMLNAHREVMRKMQKGAR